MQLAHRPIPLTARPTEEMHRLVEAISRELWRLYGRDGTLAWIGVDHHLRTMVEQARREARESLKTVAAADADRRRPTPRAERRGPTEPTVGRPDHADARRLSPGRAAG